MRKHITFFLPIIGLNGYNYIPNIKYMIQGDDGAYWHIMSDKVFKEDLSIGEFKIGFEKKVEDRDRREVRRCYT